MFKKKNWTLKFQDSVSIGKYTYGLNRESLIGIDIKTPLNVGKFCSFGPDIKIFLSSDHPTNLASTFPLKTLFIQKKPWPNLDVVSKGGVNIGNDVWVGANAMIMSGVSIQDGAIIAAGAIVTKNVSPYTIVAGNPAKTVKKRFKNSQIKSLLRIQWWNWEEDKIRKYVSDFYSDIEKFIKLHDVQN